jgi:hypothetical protein
MRAGLQPSGKELPQPLDFLLDLTLQMQGVEAEAERGLVFSRGTGYNAVDVEAFRAQIRGAIQGDIVRIAKGAGGAHHSPGLALSI